MTSSATSRRTTPRRAVHALGVTIAAISLAAGLLVADPPTGRALEPVTSGYSAGDFETVGLVPQGWTVTAPPPGRAVVSSSRAISGTRSLLVDDTSTETAVRAVRAPFAVTPGLAYHVQGYAYSTKGVQSLSLSFYTAQGVRLSTVTTPATGAYMVWSRTEVHANAPAGAALATVQIASDEAEVSQAWWDAVGVITPTLANTGFETAPTTTSPTPSWTRSVSGGATATVTTALARTGSRSLAIVDLTRTGAASVTSVLVPAFPNVSHDVRTWVRPTSGSFTLTVRWYDASRALVKSQAFPVSKVPGVWSLVAAQVTSPSNAHFAALQVSTSVAGTASGAWDLFSIVPTPGAPVHAYFTAAHGEPIDAFSNSNTSGVAVIAGRPKLYTLVSGFPAEFQLADLQTGSVELRLPVPGMDVGWALATGTDGAVYFGGSGGHLWRFLPTSRTLEDLGRVTASATTVWDLEIGPDGRVWGVSYPRSELWSYTPGPGTFTNLGTVSATHDYARSLAVDSSYAYVGVGSTDPTIVRVSLSNPSSTQRLPLPTPVRSGNISELEIYGRFLAVRTPSGLTTSGVSYTGERRLYDTRTGSWDVAANMTGQSPSGMDSHGRFYYLSYKQLWAVDSMTGAKTAVASTTMAAGRDRPVLSATLDGVAGEWLLAYDAAGTVQAINLDTFEECSYPVSFLPTKMRIKTLDAGPNDSVYLGGFGGPSLSIVRPESGVDSRQQYPTSPVGASSIGELEGTVMHGSVQYVGTYTDGKIFRLDTTRPWVEGSNPRLLTTLGTTHRQDRPMAWATAGNRTFFGTVPKYGVLGGVLGIIESDTSLPLVVPSPVPAQSIVSLAASGNVVYGGTSRWGGLGATPTATSGAIFAYDAAARRTLWTSTPIPGIQAWGAVSLGPRGTIWAASGPLLVELDPRTGALLRRIMVYPAPAVTGAAYRNADLVYADGVFYLAAMDRVYVVDPATLRVTAAVPSGLSTPQLALVGDRVYYASGTTLKSVNR